MSMSSEPGAGISARRMASAEASSKRSDMRVLQAFTSRPMIIRLMTMKMMWPRRMLGRSEALLKGTEGRNVVIFLGRTRLEGKISQLEG